MKRNKESPSCHIPIRNQPLKKIRLKSLNIWKYILSDDGVRTDSDKEQTNPVYIAGKKIQFGFEATNAWNELRDSYEKVRYSYPTAYLEGRKTLITRTDEILPSGKVQTLAAAMLAPKIQLLRTEPGNGFAYYAWSNPGKDPESVEKVAQAYAFAIARTSSGRCVTKEDAEKLVALGQGIQEAILHQTTPEEKQGLIDSANAIDPISPITLEPIHSTTTNQVPRMLPKRMR